MLLSSASQSHTHTQRNKHAHTHTNRNVFIYTYAASRNCALSVALSFAFAVRVSETNILRRAHNQRRNNARLAYIRVLMISSNKNMYFNFSLGRVRNMYTHIHKCIYTYAHGPCVYAGLLYSYSFVSCISFATTYNTYAHTYIHLFSLLTHSHTHIRTLAPILPQAVEHIPLFLCSMHIRFEFTPFSCFFLFLHFFFASYLCSICNFIFLALTHLF